MDRERLQRFRTTLETKREELARASLDLRSTAEHKEDEAAADALGYYQAQYVALADVRVVNEPADKQSEEYNLYNELCLLYGS